MPKLPHLPRRSPPPGEAARLSRWFRERDLALRLWEEMPEEYAKALRSPPISERAHLREHADLVAPFDRDLQVGQIRILHGGMFPEMRRPMHVAILSEWPAAEAPLDEGVRQTSRFSRNIVPLPPSRRGLSESSEALVEEKSYLVSPFSDYSEPATTTEWLTGLEADPLRVLCLWNTRDYPAEWLELGWKVGELTPQELADAREVFRHALTGVPLSDRLRQQVGAPIFHSRDPRLAYQEEEARLFTIVPEYAQYRWKLEEATRIQDSPGGFGGLSLPTSGRNLRPAGLAYWPQAMENEELALAAATSTGGLRKMTYLISELQVRLVLRLESDKQTLSINVYDPSGQPSKALDQAELVNASGEPLARLSSASGRVAKASMQNGFALRLVDGRMFVPKPVD